MGALKNILSSAIAELGAEHEHVVMLRSLLESRLQGHGVSLNNTSRVITGQVRVVNEP